MEKGVFKKGRTRIRSLNILPWCCSKDKGVILTQHPASKNQKTASVDGEKGGGPELELGEGFWCRAWT